MLTLMTAGSVANAADTAGAPPPTVTAPGTGATSAAPATPPAPYSLPWQLRPAAVATVVRSDTTAAFYKNPMNTDLAGSTIASTLLASYKVTPSIAPFLRIAAVQNQVPGPTLGGAAAFVNPIVGAAYGSKFGPDFRYAAMLAAAIPIGMGGDKAPGMDATAAASAAGIPARSAMDNAMFAVNYFVGIGGFDLAYVAHKLTAQVEVTVLHLLRTRNADVPSAADASRTNLTAGIHLGYFVLPMLSLGGELRHQRWLSTPKAVAANEALRDTTTFGVGPRFHFKVGNATWIRPGLSYSRALDDPLAAANYHIVQLDVPVVF